MIVEIVVFIITTLIAYFLYSYKKFHSYYEGKGVKYLPGIPIFGNVFKSTILKTHIWEDIDVVYKAFPDEKYVGFIEAITPIVIIRDPELIKTITVKDFDHFSDHRAFFPEEIEPLFGGSLFMMKGDRWRDMRTTLSPAFTGSKMRHMMPFMIEISENIIDYLKDHQSEDIDLGEVMRRYTNDVIASTGFGLQVNSLKDKNNEFYKTGQNIFSFTFMQRFWMFFLAIFPELSKKIGVKIFPEETTTFFTNLVLRTMEYREKNNVERPDMIQLLMEASKGTLKHTSENTERDVGFATTEEVLKPKGTVREWTQNELVGQVFLFFVAGFESSASVMVMCVHELAINHDIQEKLYQEISEFKKRNSKLTYENIIELKYLDCVLNETLRKWSPALILDRVCIKPYDLPPPREGGQSYRVNPGDVVYNSVNSIHMDPKYYSQPDMFDPDRFSDENKHKIQPFTFMPFGMGPRNCIGSRFALLELKVILYDLVSNFKILKCAKTTDPIKLLPKDFNIKAKDGTWVKLEARNK